jgi:hypothetical protein
MLVGGVTRVKAPLGVILVVAVAASLVSVESQTAGKNKAIRPRAPELEVKVIPSKTTYALHEDVFTKTEFINLTDKTLCFPEPAQGQQVVASGSLTTMAVPVNPPESTPSEADSFIDHWDGGPAWPRERLLSEIEEGWVKLAPNQVHVTKSTKARVDWRFSGQWQLRATYNPPGCSFNIAECTRYLKSAAQNVGCTVPEIQVDTKYVAVNVVPPPEQKQSIK